MTAQAVVNQKCVHEIKRKNKALATSRQKNDALTKDLIDKDLELKENSKLHAALTSELTEIKKKEKEGKRKCNGLTMQIEALQAENQTLTESVSITRS